jgi:hypothetical protein
MIKSKKKHPRDLNKLASVVVKLGTEGEPPEKSSDKNPHAVALGRLGGLKGGKARAEKLTKRQRQEIARKAAKTRWSKKK